MLRDPQIVHRVTNASRDGYISEELEWKLFLTLVTHLFLSFFLPFSPPSLAPSSSFAHAHPHTHPMIHICQPANEKEQELVEDSDVQRDKHLQLITRAFLPKTSCEKFVACFILKNVDQVTPALQIAWKTKRQHPLLICLVVNVYEQHDALIDRRYFIWASHQPFAVASVSFGSRTLSPRNGQEKKRQVSHLSSSAAVILPSTLIDACLALAECPWYHTDLSLKLNLSDVNKLVSSAVLTNFKGSQKSANCIYPCYLFIKWSGPLSNNKKLGKWDRLRFFRGSPTIAYKIKMQYFRNNILSFVILMYLGCQRYGILSLAVSNERRGFHGGSALKNLSAMLEMQVRSLSRKNTLEECHGNPLQCSCLENPMDRGAWWAADRRVTKSHTPLKWLTTLARNGGRAGEMGFKSQAASGVSPWYQGYKYWL